MRRNGKFSNQSGQGTVENLMLTVVIAGLLIPVVYKFALVPLLDTMQGQRKNLVDFVAQNNKKPVPNDWFASEQLAKIKETKDIEAPQDIKSTEIPEPGEISSSEVKEPKDIKPTNIKAPKAIPPPKSISASNTPSGGGAGGTGSALGSGATDPDFFGSGNKGGGAESKSEKSDELSGSGASLRGGYSDEYSPKKSREESRGASKTEKGDSKQSVEGSVDRNTRKNLVLSQTREEERARSSPFNWWLLIKVLIIGLIIFLVILIGLGNMKKR